MFAPIPVALGICLLLALIGWRTGAPRWRGLAMVWALYAGYEALMYARILCTGECNIRVDLLLIYPALLISTVWLVIAGIYRAVKRRGEAQSDR